MKPMHRLLVFWKVLAAVAIFLLALSAPLTLISAPKVIVHAAALAGTQIYLPFIDKAFPAPPPPVPQSGDPVINAVGDIAACSPKYVNRYGFYQTAALLIGLNGPIFGLGDYAYDDSSPTLFSTCFDPIWGQFKARTYPVPGNHEYQYTGAAGYYGYYGAAAGDPTQGYYSFDIGSWHIIALNSNCAYAGTCLLTGTQVQWLQADLAAHPAKCTLAYWHHPLYSSGKEGNSPEVQPFWQVLYANHVDLIINGHDHSYERFAPIDPNGNPDPVNGIPEFVVGTGGKDHSPLRKLQPNSQVFQNTDYGVLRLTLHADGYDWQFVPVAGGTFTDSGSGTCH